MSEENGSREEDEYVIGSHREIDMDGFTLGNKGVGGTTPGKSSITGATNSEFSEVSRSSQTEYSMKGDFVLFSGAFSQ